MQTVTDIIKTLGEELEKRKFQIGILQVDGFYGRGILACNSNFNSSRVRIEILPECETTVNVIIGDSRNELSPNQFNAIMKELMQHFDRYKNTQWGLVMNIYSDGQTIRDMGDIANIITRAYSLAATTV